MPATPESVLLFNALPTPHLLLSPAFVIEAVSDSYLHVTLTRREHLVGQYMFDAFPDNPQTPEANSRHNVRASLEQVLATKQPHAIGRQHYDVPDPDHPGQFVERHWQALNAPVLDAQGNVSHIIHAPVDVTAEVQAQAQLRESQVAGQDARDDAEAQRQRFHEVLMQLPAYVAVYHGPDHVYQFVNPPYQSLFPHRSFVGRPFREGTPESVDLGVVALFDRVYQTGEPFSLSELEGWFDFQGTGEPEQVFLNLYLHPLHNAQGQVNGVLDFSHNVTEQVRSRQQVEQLNQELEARVAQRTTELQAALHLTERQREQLRAQQGRLQQIMGQVPAFIATLDGPDHRHSYFNAGYEAWAGHRAQLGQSVADVFPETVPQGFINLLDEVYRTGEPFGGTEMPVELYDPTTNRPVMHYVDFLYQPLGDEPGQTTSILAFVVDVTEKVRVRQQAEALQAELLTVAQRQAHERTAFREVFQQTPALIALLRAPGHRFEYVNPAYQALFPGRQLVGLDAVVAAPELLVQGFITLLNRVYQTGETHFGTEVPFVTLATAQHPMRTAYFNFTYQAYREAGETAGVSIFAFNVTEQVSARQEREVQRQRLHDLFMQAPAAICILDGPDLVYELVNPSYQALFPGRHLHGRPILDALPEIAGHTVHRTFLEVYETGVTREELGILIPLARPVDGVLEDRYFNYIQQARTDAQGRVDGVLVFAFEVTDQVVARQRAQGLAQELTATNQQLTRTNVDLDNFIYTASHDLKAPISNIEGLLYLLQEELPPAVQQAEHVGPTLTRMLEAVERFKRTIDHLTEVSKLQKEYTSPAAAVDLAAVVEDVRQDLWPQLQETGAKLVIDVTNFPPVNFSEKNLRSIVYNLLSNALKYRSPDRTPYIDVRAHVRSGYTVFEVHDNGLGLDAQHLPKLFTMFQRFHDHVEGTGIGLYMVKRMVENAGGHLEVHSQLGAGTTFFVHLPHSLPA
jgi:signal transduction histidine kinase